jgi:hypothetical protein
MPVAAQTSSSQSPVDDLFTDEDGERVSPWEDPQAFVTNLVSWTAGAGDGLSERISYETGKITGSGETNDLATERNETITTLNDNADSIGTYLTEQTSLDETQIHAVRLADESEDKQSTFYIEATYNTTTDQYDIVNATASQPANTTVDHQHRFTGQLAQNLNEEVGYFIENYVDTGESVKGDGQYISRMAAQYGGIFGNQFQSTLLQDDYDGFEDNSQDGGDE